MGGLGSGRRWHYGAADCTDDYRRLDVRCWQRDGFLTPGQTFGWLWVRDSETVASIQVRTETDRVILSYRHRSSGSGSEWKDEEYSVRLDWTPCTYGGRRAWFQCPREKMRAAGGNSLRRRHLRLSALLPTGLPEPAGNC